MTQSDQRFQDFCMHNILQKILLDFLMHNCHALTKVMSLRNHCKQKTCLSLQNLTCKHLLVRQLSGRFHGLMCLHLYHLKILCRDQGRMLKISRLLLENTSPGSCLSICHLLTDLSKYLCPH